MGAFREFSGLSLVDFGTSAPGGETTCALAKHISGVPVLLENTNSGLRCGMRQAASV
jgi:hypothetical protein